MDPQDATNSFWEWFREKTTSPLYLTYISAFIVWNWQFFATLFLEDSANLGMSKISFINQEISNKVFFSFIPKLPYEWNVFLSNRLFEIVPPAILTYIVLYWLPPLANLVHKHSLRHYFARQQEYQKQNEDTKTQLLQSKKKEAKMLEEVSDVEKRIRRAKKELSQEQRWELEFQSMRKQNSQIDVVVLRAEKIIYGNNGYFSSVANDPRFLPAEAVSLLDVNGLVNIDKNHIEFTEKGKAYLRLLKTIPG